MYCWLTLYVPSALPVYTPGRPLVCRGRWWGCSPRTPARHLQETLKRRICNYLKKKYNLNSLFWTNSYYSILTKGNVDFIVIPLLTHLFYYDFKRPEIMIISQKNMFNLDEENIQFALGKRALVFGSARNPRMLCFFNPDVEIRGIICLWLLVLPNSNN